MELISWTIYDLKGCHKIFIMPVVEKENLSTQLLRQFLCMRSANKFTIYTCYSLMQCFSPIHNPKQLDDTEVDAVVSGSESLRAGFKVTHTSFFLFSEWHLHNVLQRGEFGWAAEMHHAMLQMSYWATLCLCSLFDVQPSHESIHNITFSFQIKPWVIYTGLCKTFWQLWPNAAN